MITDHNIVEYGMRLLIIDLGVGDPSDSSGSNAVAVGGG